MYRLIELKPITSADGRDFYATGEGNVPILMPSENGPIQVMLCNVLHAANMPLGLISISAMTQNSYRASFDCAGCCIYSPEDQLVATVPQKNDLYTIADLTGHLPIPDASAMKASIKKLMLLDLHR
jgi:hypothetical protein